MKRRILIPTGDQEGRHIADHFGRAPFFAAFDIDDNDRVVSRHVSPNTGEHTGGRGHAHDVVLSLSPDVVIVGGMGPRGIISFRNNGISVLKANSTDTESVLDAYLSGQLVELTEGCADAHHQ